MFNNQFTSPQQQALNRINGIILLATQVRLIDPILGVHIHNLMKEYQPIRIFNPSIDQKKVSPLRLKGISRLNQIYLSRMLLQCPAKESTQNYQAQYISRQGLLLVQSKTPIFITKNVHINYNKNKSKTEIGKKYMRRISDLESCLRAKQQKCLHNSINQEKQEQIKDVSHQRKRLSEPNSSAREEFTSIQKHNFKTSKMLSSNASITKNKKFRVQQNINLSKYSTTSKKLPQINKVKNSAIIKNLSNSVQKKNLPLLARNPQQLKHIKAQSYVILQHPSNTLVVTYQSNMSVQIASLTKIMTFYISVSIARKHNIDISTEKFQVGEHIMQATGTSAALQCGQIYTIQQLLYGLMLPSGNDAATCLAQWGGKFYTQQDDPNTKSKFFVMEMNREAKNLGLIGTRFGNPHGLPHIQSKSNALQVAKLSSICLNDELFINVVKTQKYVCIVQNQLLKTQRQVQWKNTNKLLRRQGFLGIKTGITVTAGPCLATAYKFRDKIYITVILRANKVSRRFKQTRKLLYWSLSKLYKQGLSEQESKLISSLNKKKSKIDSDYSEDQQEFNYDVSNQAQYNKRCDILSYEM